MALIISTGSNLGDRLTNLEQAKIELKKHFNLLASSRIFQSKAQDYKNQPDFLNQLHQFSIPEILPIEALRLLQTTEKELGRVKNFDKGPRIIDLDIIFWGDEQIQTQHLIIPHQEWLKRSFIIRPLKDLPFFKTIEKCFTIPESFEEDAFPYET